MKEERYFYVPEVSNSNELPVDEAIHAVRVLRLKESDEIFLMDGKGSFYKAFITLTNSKHCYYKIEQSLPQTKSWTGYLHLAIAPTKDISRVEWLVEKATEIGFDEISFLNCHYSERKTIRKDRIERIVISAMKQSRKPWKPIVNDMVTFDNFVRREIVGSKFICHCYDEIEKTDFFNYLKHLNSTNEITVLVGPEGDFSIDEVRQAMNNNYQCVTLGTSRLRTETAGLTAIIVANLICRK